MKKTLAFVTCLLLYKVTLAQSDFTIAFGSCNKQTETNIFWNNITQLKPNVWIWAGDNVYADKSDIKTAYQTQKQQKGYAELEKSIKIIGVWDDHDYGKNDGGTEFEKKKESQQLFLDFFNVSKNSSRRKQEGIYHTETFNTPKGSVKVILLDTRYFRTALTKGDGKNRFKPNKYNEGTILGEAQWKWFENELKTSKADFNIVVSSIQLLSNQHGFEKWANFPHEMIKFFKIVETSKAKNVIVLSGDRHISEFSKTLIENVPYPLIDFTSSGLTHTYESYKGEENPFRDGKVVNKKNYGVLKFNFASKKVTFQIKGENDKIIQEITQIYK